MIFDSDVLIWSSRSDAEAIALVNSTRDRAVSIITVMEILQGVRSKSEMRTTKQFFHQMNFRIPPLTESIGHIAAGLIEEHALSGGLRIEDAAHSCDCARSRGDSGDCQRPALPRHRELGSEALPSAFQIVLA